MTLRSAHSRRSKPMGEKRVGLAALRWRRAFLFGGDDGKSD
jgi:hypothetical protein